MDGIEVAVIGAGIHGVSVAHNLASRGVAVRVYDQGSVAAGPTARSSAVCRAYYTNEFLARAAHESLDVFRNFAAVTNGRDCGYRQNGALYLHPAEDLDQLHQVAAMLNGIGTRVEILEGDDLVGLAEGFDLTGIAAGAWEVDAGYADPVNASQGLLERAVELGAETRLYTRIVDVKATAGGGAVLTTAGGDTVRARRLVLCVGPWTRSMAAKVGVDLPLTAERHLIASFGWAGVKPIAFTYADMVNGIYVKPDGRELFIVGSLLSGEVVDPDNFQQALEFEEQLDFASSLERRVPPLGQADARGGWAALYDLSPDWQPVIGEIEDGVYVTAGTSGHGFKLAPALGRHIADLVCGQPDAGLAQFSALRFQEHHELAAGFGRAKILG
jgi:sarcosine oxidase, subunit beta